MIQWARHFLCTLASVSPPGVIPEQTEPEVKPLAHLCVAKKQVKKMCLMRMRNPVASKSIKVEKTKL